MTLVATTSNFGFPIMVGDLLVSIDKDTNHTTLPSIHNNISPYLKNKGKISTELHNKIYILNSCTAIAFAGSVYEIKLFLDDLRNQFKLRTQFEIDDIRSYLEELQLNKNFESLQFSLIHISNNDNETILHSIEYPESAWKKSTSILFGNISACGSGAKEFINLATEPQNYESSIPKEKIESAISLNISLFTRILALESTTLHTINSGWGGGFEAIIYNGQSFEKVEDVAFLTSVETIQNPSVFIPPNMVQYYRYVDSILIIYSFSVNEWKIENKEDFFLLQSNQFELKIFDVSPMYGNALEKKQQIVLPTFRTTKIAHGYALITEDEGVIAPAYFTNDNLSYIEFDINRGITLRLDRQYFDIIARNYFAPNEFR